MGKERRSGGKGMHGYGRAMGIMAIDSNGNRRDLLASIFAAFSYADSDSEIEAISQNRRLPLAQKYIHDDGGGRVSEWVSNGGETSESSHQRLTFKN